MKFIPKYLAILFVFTITALLGADKVLNAQTFDPIGTGVIGQQISSTVSSENPAPGETVNISLTAYGTNLNAATISWSVNGTVAQRGVGITQFSVTAGQNGQTKRVVATINPTSGPVITRSFTISSQEVSIIYESDGYVPPFYKGKGVYGREGSVNLVAMPNLISSNGVRLAPGTLTYKWIIDGTVQGSKSGYGRNSLLYTGTILGQDTLIEVEVSSTNGATKGKGAILLSPLDSQVLLYEVNPVYGLMFNTELSSQGFNLKGKEGTVSAIPYSTSASNLNDGTLSYVWTINGATIPVPKTQNIATFRNSANQQGSSLIGVSVSNTTHLLQMMRNSLSINF